MEQLVRIKDVCDDGTAQVMVIRESACSGDCHKCAGCGAVQQTVLLQALNAIGAKPGEVAIITSQSAPVLRGAAVLYMVPMLLFFLGYILGAQWQLGGLLGGMGFGAGILLAVVYDRCVVKKQNTVYTITGYPAQKRADP